jgi:hypothetical protein
MLLCRQLLCTLGNLTTNELLMRHKYGYLRDEAGQYRCEWVNCFLEGGQ